MSQLCKNVDCVPAKRASFGYINAKAKYKYLACKLHKKDDMQLTVSTCQEPVCVVNGSFTFPGKSRADGFFCKKHKKDGMQCSKGPFCQGFCDDGTPCHTQAC